MCGTKREALVVIQIYASFGVGEVCVATVGLTGAG